MGCDIHARIEFRPRCLTQSEATGGEWQTFAEPSLGRRYEYFAALAGVRSELGATPPLYPTRGLPISQYDDLDGRYQDMRHDESHSHSHLLLPELEAALIHAGIAPSEMLVEWRTALAAMKTLAEAYEVRLVFCFTH